MVVEFVPHPGMAFANLLKHEQVLDKASETGNAIRLASASFFKTGTVFRSE